MALDQIISREIFVGSKEAAVSQQTEVVAEFLHSGLLLLFSSKQASRYHWQL